LFAQIGDLGGYLPPALVFTIFTRVAIAVITRHTNVLYIKCICASYSVRVPYSGPILIIAILFAIEPIKNIARKNIVTHLRVDSFRPSTLAVLNVFLLKLANNLS